MVVWDFALSSLQPSFRLSSWSAAPAIPAKASHPRDLRHRETCRWPYRAPETSCFSRIEFAKAFSMSITGRTSGWLYFVETEKCLPKPGVI